MAWVSLEHILSQDRTNESGCADCESSLMPEPPSCPLISHYARATIHRLGCLHEDKARQKEVVWSYGLYTGEALQCFHQHRLSQMSRKALEQGGCYKDQERAEGEISSPILLGWISVQFLSILQELGWAISEERKMQQKLGVLKSLFSCAYFKVSH